MPLYLAEACWKYNNRANKDAFEDALEAFVR